jgi:hypothetical protein
MYAVITKLDPQGNILWRNYLESLSYEYISITGVDIDAEDKVTFVTTVFWGSRIQLWTVNSAGEMNPLSYPVEIPIMGITFNKALRTSNNEIVAVGMASQDFHVSSACFFRFSATGDTLVTAFWPAELGSPLQRAEAYDLALMDNGNAYVTCSLHTGLGSVLEIDTAGELVNRIDLPDDLRNNAVFSSLAIARIIGDESCLIAGTFDSYPNTIIKVYSLLGNEVTHLFDIDNSILEFVSTLLPYPGGMFICGSLSFYCGKVINLSTSGELIWSRNQQGENLCTYIAWDGFGSPSTALLGLDPTGSIYWAWGNIGTQVIIKLLPNGQLPIDDDVAAPSISRITAYPNPMKDHLSIKITQDVQAVIGENRVDIFNIKGQLVRSIQFSKDETEWDGKDSGGKPCPQGIYLLRYQYGRGQVTKICKTYLEDI